MYCQEPNILSSQISLTNSRKVRSHGKRTPLPNKIKEDQAKKSLEERIYVLHANNLGSQDIDVPKGRHTTLNFFSEDDEEEEEEEAKIEAQE